MQLTVARLALLVVAAASVLVAGCGSSDTENEYVDTVNGIQQDIVDAVTAATATQPDGRAEAVDQVQTGADTLGGTVDDLEAVEVPEEAQEGHDELIAAITDLRTLFSDTVATVEESSDTGVFTALTQLSRDAELISAQIDRAISKINSQLGAQ